MRYISPPPFRPTRPLGLGRNDDQGQIVDQEVIDTFQQKFEMYLSNVAETLTEELDLSYYVDISGDGYGEWDVDVDSSGIRRDLAESLSGIVNSFDYSVIKGFCLNLNQQIDDIDTSALGEKYLRSQQEEDRDDYRGGDSGSNSDQSIDDLFQRT